jgi:hypothetical protein
VSGHCTHVSFSCRFSTKTPHFCPLQPTNEPSIQYACKCTSDTDTRSLCVSTSRHGMHQEHTLSMISKIPQNFSQCQCTYSISVTANYPTPVLKQNTLNPHNVLHVSDVSLSQSWHIHHLPLAHLKHMEPMHQHSF